MLVDDCSGWYNKYRPCLAVQLWDLHLEEMTMTEKGNCIYSNNVALVIKLDGRQAMRRRFAKHEDGLFVQKLLLSLNGGN